MIAARIFRNRIDCQLYLKGVIFHFRISAFFFLFLRFVFLIFDIYVRREEGELVNVSLVCSGAPETFLACDRRVEKQDTDEAEGKVIGKRGKVLLSKGIYT